MPRSSVGDHRFTRLLLEIFSLERRSSVDRDKHRVECLNRIYTQSRGDLVCDIWWASSAIRRSILNESILFPLTLSYPACFFDGCRSPRRPRVGDEGNGGGGGGGNDDRSGGGDVLARPVSRSEECKTRKRRRIGKKASLMSRKLDRKLTGRVSWASSF